ncbi:TetR/AcrR family transcriptional regulator [Rhodococcus sp. PAMC28707]|uniref:TetR/AcrR family transcriptional regulator n=1 Tax=unclassified Rhodococcus (in: high G+C Gram-positive bacteria) TaxID=192944 RepID=UPI00109DCAB6|nr:MULTISPECIES: TetR/AcrR family transcriptional regulator [unclassified Rhodococcus (in: high G+C Gram-positive bacteria)]QCB50483.1 TetR/AcrR family transcriptional regulator [Rhodococcus sp. PAMC28705]QCB57825.1 TetR/AcrR family transcriptional regulator [Rhodococcus sp. PAMC28707]
MSGDAERGSWRIYEGSVLSAPLAAALAAFVEQGYHGASVREIAARAGLSVPGLYHHFPSKQALLVGLMKAAMADLLQRSRVAETEAGTSPSARFDAVVTSLLLFHMYRRDQAFIGSTEIRSLEADNRSEYIGQRDEQQRMLDTIVHDGVESGDFDTEYPEDASRAVTTLCVGIAGWYRPDGPLSAPELAAVYLTIARKIVGGSR